MHHQFPVQPLPARGGHRPQGGGQDQGRGQARQGLQRAPAELQEGRVTVLESVDGHTHQDRGRAGLQICGRPSEPSVADLGIGLRSI